MDRRMAGEVGTTESACPTCWGGQQFYGTLHMSHNFHGIVCNADEMYNILHTFYIFPWNIHLWIHHPPYHLMNKIPTLYSTVIGRTGISVHVMYSFLALHSSGTRLQQNKTTCTNKLAFVIFVLEMKFSLCPDVSWLWSKPYCHLTKHGPKPWFTIVNHELPWSTMKYHGQPQTNMSSSQFLAMFINGTMVFDHGSSWLTMVVHG